MRRRSFLGALAASATLPRVVGAVGAVDTQDDLSPGFVVDVPGLHEAVAGPDGRYVYGAASDALAVIDCDSVDSPSLVGHTEATMNGEAMTGLGDVELSGDRAFVAGPTGFVDDGQQSGGVLFDVSDPANPEQVAAIPTDHAVHNVALDGDVAYLTGYMLPRQPVVVYDVSGDRPEELARWSVLSENDAWSQLNRSLYQVHDVTARGDRAYVSYWDAGTWILDVSDPANPTPVTHVGGVDPSTLTDVEGQNVLQEVGQLPGNSHNTALSPDGTLLALGREAFDRNPGDDRYGGPGGIGLWDVTDDANPRFVTALQPPVVTDADGRKTTATTHNFAFRGDRLYAAWYSAGVRVYDLADPPSPERLGAWAAPSEASFWTAEPLDDGFVGASYVDPSAPDAERRNSENAKLYTFPEPDAAAASPAETFQVNATGVPADPPAHDFLETTESTTSTTGSTAGTTTDSVSDPSTATPEPGDGSGGSVPGFGVAAAVAGTALAALHRFRGGE